LSAALTGLVSLVFADLLWRTGWSGARAVLLVLFIVLFFFTCVGCMHGVYGFVLRRIGDARRITSLADYKSRSIEGVSVAVIFPIYGEEAKRVFEGLRATYESLGRSGHLGHFDFFVLSDTTDVDKWVEEERRWYDLVRDFEALGRIYYRRRITNEGKKCGNIREFLNAWGRRYRYFIVFDADSVMRGGALVDLVRLMEAHPQTGLVQTIPTQVNAESLFGRARQFAGGLYGPIHIAGLNYWAQGCGNYWGHNAIIRAEPFMKYCDLPQLPGRKPFGGQILSHDFVEAALLLRENWEVWLACDIEGSYEEAPQEMIENARRDRRWCQGNLQHSLLLFARGLNGASRMHLLLGIFGYLCSPLWLAFLITFCWMRARHNFTGLSNITVHALTPFLTLTETQHALLVFGICMFLIFLPKALALLDLGFDRNRRAGFGGWPKAAAGVLLESVLSALEAPLQMLWHSKFVVTILLGAGVHWGPQARNANGTAWSEAFRAHWGHTLVGLCWGGFFWFFDRASFFWFLPLTAGLVLAVPMSVLTSRPAWGRFARRLGLFLTPAESSPPPELESLRRRMDTPEQTMAEKGRPNLPGLAEIVLDPYTNAIHVSLLREKQLNPEYATTVRRLSAGQPPVRALAEKLLAEGPKALGPEEIKLILADPDTMSWLHRRSWLRPNETLASWWQSALREYAL
jgi:membrane glycosyltransferase